MRVLTAKCPFCGAPVDATIDKLKEPVDCPKCGRPFEIEIPVVSVSEVREIPDAAADQTTDLVQETGERVLVKTHPAIFRARPLRILGCLILIGLGAAGAYYAWMSGASEHFLWIGAACVLAGLTVLFAWWIGALATSLTLTNRRTILRRGLFSRETTEVQHDDVRNIQMEQSFLERIFHVGDIGISSSGQAGLEIVARSIPHPNTVVRLIRENQN